jgi:hypothetical protein
MDAVVYWGNLYSRAKLLGHTYDIMRAAGEEMER